MATQDNSGTINFGSVSAEVNRPAQYALFSAASGGTRYSANADLDAIVDGSGSAITANTIANGTTVEVPIADADLSETLGDLNETGRARMLQLMVEDGWHIALFDAGDIELTGAAGLTRQEVQDANFSA